MNTNQPKITTDMIPIGQDIFVTGVVDYSHITSHIEGQALIDDNARKQKMGMIAEDKPHTRINISQASVAYKDPANPTIGEQYIESRLFESTKKPEKGKCYEGKSKSLNLPKVYKRGATQGVLDEVIPEGELAPGQRVTLIVRCFGNKDKPGIHNGIALEGVLCEEVPIKYYGSAGSNAAAALQARGYQINPASPAEIEAAKAKLAANAARSAAAVTPAPAVAPPTSYGAPAATAPPATYGAPAVAPAPAATPAPVPVPPPVSAATSYAVPVPPPATGVAAPEVPATPGTASYPPPNVNPTGGVQL